MHLEDRSNGESVAFLSDLACLPVPIRKPGAVSLELIRLKLEARRILLPAQGRLRTGVQSSPSVGRNADNRGDRPPRVFGPRIEPTASEVLAQGFGSPARLG